MPLCSLLPSACGFGVGFGYLNTEPHRVWLEHFCMVQSKNGEKTKTRWWQLKHFWNFHPYLGKIPMLTNIFQRGWNHQLEKVAKMRSLRASPPTWICENSPPPKRKGVQSWKVGWKPDFLGSWCFWIVINFGNGWVIFFVLTHYHGTSLMWRLALWYSGKNLFQAPTSNRSGFFSSMIRDHLLPSESKRRASKIHSGLYCWSEGPYILNGFFRFL